MQRREIEILIIEDNFGDVVLIQKMLAQVEGVKCQFSHADHLNKGLQELESNSFDVVLLDLGLPDSQGLNTFLEVHNQVPHLPIIVLTGNVDQSVVQQSLRAGAQDYLNKNEITEDLLLRSIRYALERQALLSELEGQRQKKRQKEELLLLGKLSANESTAATAAVFGIGPLRETLPDVFGQMVFRYEELMDKALEVRAYKVDYDFSNALRELGDDLGVLKATPKDVVEIHTVALRNKYKESSPKKARFYKGEGTYMLIETMGYLTSYYRRYIS